MPFVQRVVEPKYLSRTSLWDADGNPRVTDYELEAVTNNTLSNALRQLASLVLVADDIFTELGNQLQGINKRSDTLKTKIGILEARVTGFDPKKVTVPESDICTFSRLKKHYEARHVLATNLFSVDTRPAALKELYEAASKTPVQLMRQMDRWRRDGHRSSRFFLCTPVLGAKRRRIKTKVDIDIETRMPAAVEELRRWTSSEALGDVTVTPDCTNRIVPNVTVTDGEMTDGTVASDDEGIDHKLPSPEEQLQVVALKFPAEIVAVDVSGRSFDRMSVQRRSLLHADANARPEPEGSIRRRNRTRKPRSRRRNTLAGTDQKEIQNALCAGEELSPSAAVVDAEPSNSIVCRSKSSDLLRSSSKKESPDTNKKSHFNTLKQWGKNRLKMINKSSESKSSNEKKYDPDEVNIYETVTVKRKRNIDKDRRSHERNPSVSSSEKCSVNIPATTPMSSVMNIAVKLRESSAQRRMRRTGGNKDEPHSSSGNWSASSESGRASIGSEITNTTHPKSTSSCTSSNSLNQHAPSSVNSRRKFNANTSTSSSVTSEGTLTPDIIHDLHEDGETSSVYSCDTEGYYTSFHMDSGLKTLKEEEMPMTPLHCTSTFSNSPSNTILTAENEYELFGKGSTSTTTSSAGTVCTTLRAAESSRSLIIGPAVPERKSSLSKVSNKDKSPGSSLERDFSSDKTGTVKRSPATGKSTVVAVIHNETKGDVSPDSGHNTSSSPIESTNSPNGVRSGSEFEFSESSDMEGPDRIERIRIKTTINSSRIPSMCVITPPHSDDESVKSDFSAPTKIRPDVLGSRNTERSKLELALKANKPNNDVVLRSSDSDKENCMIQTRIVNSSDGTKMHLININQQSGYATVETVDAAGGNKKGQETFAGKPIRAPSPSGGTVTVKDEKVLQPQSQPLFKASLLPLNNMFGRLKSNLVTFALKGKSPEKNGNEILYDSGEYVTIADVRNNNEKASKQPSDVGSSNLSTVLSGRIRETEYVSLNELPCNDANIQGGSVNDSLERKRRQGARVTLDAEGKVVYSSDSLKRRKGAHTTFDPGPFIKQSDSPTASPLPSHRNPKTIRPVTNTCQNDQLDTPQSGKFVIKASSGLTSASEIVRLPPSTIVSPSTRPMSPKSNNARGAYVHMQDNGRPLSPTQEKERVPSSSNQHSSYNMALVNMPSNPRDSYWYYPSQVDDNFYHRSNIGLRGSPAYRTLPARRTQLLNVKVNKERSVTPDITRGLDSNIKSYAVDWRCSQDLYNRQANQDLYDQQANQELYNRQTNQELYNRQTNQELYSRQMNQDFYSRPISYVSQYQEDKRPLDQKLGIPVSMPQISNADRSKVLQVHYNSPVILENQIAFKQIHKGCEYDERDSITVSPIDPRNSGGFQSSTPSSKSHQDLKSAVNLESKLLSPKKSTMSNEELYAVIHKSKKKMNIDSVDSNKVVPLDEQIIKTQPKTPETGYLPNKSKSRLSWSPNKGEYIDFNTDINRLSPNNESRSRQSWACSDRKGTQQTTRLDFKKLLLQHGKTNIISNKSKKLSAVEQLKLSKQQIQPTKSSNLGQPEMSILELSGSPRSLVNRKFNNGSPKHNAQEKSRSVPKLMSPRSQWRFTNPRSDVLSSTILEDCREDENSNNSAERKKISDEKAECSNQGSITESNTDKLASDNTVTSQSTNFVNRQLIPGDTEKRSGRISISQRIQAQRAQFFNLVPPNPTNSSSTDKNSQINLDDKKSSAPTLETAF